MQGTIGAKLHFTSERLSVRREYMGSSDAGVPVAAEETRNKLLWTLEQLLAIEATELTSTLDQASQLMAEALAADKIDAFLYDASSATLVAIGTSQTPMARHQVSIGLDRLPVANGGRAVEVFQTGVPYFTGRVDLDEGELVGIRKALGVRSAIMVPLQIGATRRGVLAAASARLDAFTSGDARFLDAVSRWVGMVAHRAELVESIRQEAVNEGMRMAAEELILVLAHDLGNHLTPLAGRIDMICRRARAEGNKRHIEDVTAAQSAIVRLRRLVSDLLDVGRLERGIFSLSLQTVDLVPLVQQAARMLETDVSRVRLDLPEALVVTADPDRIRQIVENLITNAINHSPKGLPVDVEARSEARHNGDWAVIVVRDQGPGISSDLLPRLFTRFARGPESTGLGLGLYLAHSLAVAHGGTLEAESTLGQGSSFRLSLPAEQNAPDATC
jgi:two-component system, OmpR family, sensor kinase